MTEGGQLPEFEVLITTVMGCLPNPLAQVLSERVEARMAAHPWHCRCLDLDWCVQHLPHAVLQTSDGDRNFMSSFEFPMPNF